MVKVMIGAIWRRRRNRTLNMRFHTDHLDAPASFYHLKNHFPPDIGMKTNDFGMPIPASEYEGRTAVRIGLVHIDILLY